MADFIHSRAKRRWLWEEQWKQEKFLQVWRNRGIAPEIVQAVESGWLPAKGTVLDIGCGLGEIAGWFAQRGYKAAAFDIAEFAVTKGRQMHSHLPSPPEFFRADVCAGLPPGQYDILIDRGCLHTIPDEDVPAYVRNIAAIAAPDVRFLLFMKAFRKGIPFGEPTEKTRWVKFVRNAFDGVFTIEKFAETFLNPGSVLPGLVFWLKRSPHRR